MYVIIYTTELYMYTRLARYAVILIGSGMRVCVCDGHQKDAHKSVMFVYCARASRANNFIANIFFSSLIIYDIWYFMLKCVFNILINKIIPFRDVFFFYCNMPFSKCGSRIYILEDKVRILFLVDTRASFCLCAVTNSHITVWHFHLNLYRRKFTLYKHTSILNIFVRCIRARVVKMDDCFIYKFLHECRQQICCTPSEVYRVLH